MVRIGGDTPKPTQKDSIPRARAKREQIHTKHGNVQTTGNIGRGRLNEIERKSWEQRVNPDEMPRPAKKDKPCNGAALYTANPYEYLNNGYPVGAANTADQTAGAKQPGIFESWFNKLINTSGDYPQAVDMSKFKTPEAKEAAIQTTRTVANFMKTDSPMEVGDPNSFADNIIYTMNPKGDGKTVTVDQAMKYFTTVDRDSANPDARNGIKTMVENLADADGNISCEKLQTALKSAVVNGKTDTNNIYAALTNAGLEKSFVGKDGKSYFLRMSPDGNEIKMFLDDNGKIGQEVPFDENNFLV